MQREPVMVTKNNRLVGAIISIKDAGDTLFPELLLEKEAGHESGLPQKFLQGLKREGKGSRL
jgi:hypothetical protein